MTKTINLIDSTFIGANAIGLAGQNAGEHPESFKWNRSTTPSNITVFTDLRLKEAVGHPAKKKIGLLIEPRAVNKVSCQTALELRDHFDTILTHDRELLQTGEPFKFYPYGGSWIKRWGLFPKTKLVSIIVGNKTSTEGHRLRHLIAERFGDKIDLWGEPYTNRQPSKVPMLRPYMYSVVIENEKRDYWFTEKLTDCFSQGTIPIYWGCPLIGRFFKVDGMIRFDSARDIEKVLDQISAKAYENRVAMATINLAVALHYRCAEDWIMERYPWLLKS